MIPNGGFPPIRLCKVKKNDNKTQTKEREYVSNISVKQIFNIDKKKLILEDNKKDQIDEI